MNVKKILKYAMVSGGMLALTTIGSGCKDILSPHKSHGGGRNAPACFEGNLPWMAYAPTNFDPTTGAYPDEASIRSDLEVLANINIDGIVTYGSDNSLGQIPRIAKEVGIPHIIMGVWDPLNQEEIGNAIEAKIYVDGYCIGNEGLDSRYDFTSLEGIMTAVRSQTNKPVTTTEALGSYADQKMLNLGDWVFPNAHPYWQGIKDATSAVQWTVDQHNILSSRTSAMVVFKKVGLPSEGEPGLSEANQNAYYRGLENACLDSPQTKIVQFEAFDQPWKNNPPVEPHWGFFTAERVPKTVATPQVLHTFVPTYGTFDNLQGRVVNVKPQDFKISTYIFAAGSWWMKPTYANPLTTIDPKGRWITDITTGGIDQLGTPIRSYLVMPTFNPPYSPPSVNGIDVLHSVTSERPR